MPFWLRLCLELVLLPHQSEGCSYTATLLQGVVSYVGVNLYYHVFFVAMLQQRPALVGRLDWLAFPCVRLNRLWHAPKGCLIGAANQLVCCLLGPLHHGELPSFSEQVC